MNALRRLAAVVAAVVGMVTLVGCNTVAGVGKDIKKGGEAIEKAAK